MAQKLTSVDLAKLIGVSQSTVSRAFSHDASVAPETRQKVLEAARQLGYTPNAIARSLITQQTNIVGILTSNITSPFQPYVLEKIIYGLQNIGKQALVFSAGPNQEIDDVLPTVLQYQVDALIVTAATLSSKRLAEQIRIGMPVILFNRSMPGEKVTSVCCDNVEGGRMVANLLLDAGHKKLAYIAGSQNSSTNREREKGFFDRLEERGVSKVLRQQAQYTYNAGYEAVSNLLSQPQPPDGIFCASDIIALGVLDYAREHNIKVPTELSVIGFDDIPMANWSAYSLTTVSQPVDEMVAMTLKLLTEQLAEPDTEAVKKLFSGKLIKRNSARLAL